MNPFSVENLSPLLRYVVPCEFPFGLAWTDLAPFLPDFDPQSPEKVQALISYEKQGLHDVDNSRILSIRYPVGNGELRTQTIFVKRNSNPYYFEAQRYLYLASLGTPVPNLLGEIKKEGDEIILLEFLPKIGIDFSSPAEVNAMLELAAQLNAVQTAPAAFKSQPGMLQDQFDADVRSALVELERRQAQDQHPIKVEPDRWFQYYKQTGHIIKGKPRGLCHNQFSFQQVGWAQRGSTRQLVVFDLQTMDLGPRFFDLTGILFALSIYTGRDQLELFRVYLDQLSQQTGVKMSFDEALAEFRYTRIYSMVESFPWLVAWTNEQPDALDASESLKITIESIYDDLSNLGW